MLTISPDLGQRLRKTLTRCNALQSDRALHAIFVDARLTRWRDLVPENAPDRATRISLLIDYFYDQSTDNGENALILLLHVLAENTSPDDVLHNKLLQLANELRRSQSPGDLQLTHASINVQQTVETIARYEFDWIIIPAGPFLMGSDQQMDQNARDNEKPIHSVDIPEYRITKTPITNAQYKLFVDESSHRYPETWKGSGIPEGKSNHPVAVVSWYDAQAFCAWAGVRLPTEAEWEKAARGTDGRIYPWGNDSPDKSRCNFDVNVGDTTPVGAYPLGASPYGVLDMAGNVWEFTSDLLKPYPYSTSVSETSGTERNRVLRGGAFDDFYWYMRCALRSQFYPANWKGRYGFRVVKL